VTSFPKEELNRVVRLPERGHYDKDEIYPIVDSAILCHVAFQIDGQPHVIPTLHARDGDTLLLHGSSASRMVRHAAAGHPLSVAVTQMDGIVLARTAFNHSINYRSAVLYGTARLVEDPAEKNRALELFMEKLIPQRWYDARPPNAQELKATGLLRMAITSASGKVRTGSANDHDEDLELPGWAGVVPARMMYGDPVDAPTLKPGIPAPGYVRDWVKKLNS